MKKYCLTQCAKDKLSKGWHETINMIAAILIGLLFIIVVIIISFVLGFIYYHTFTYFGIEMKEITKLSEYAPFGFSITVGLAIIGVLVYHTWRLLKYLFNGTRNILTNQVNRYQGNDYEKCTIFEECKEEEDDNMEKNTNDS